MADREFVLSVEEVAFAMSAAGSEDVAGGFLLALLGEREQAEVDGRLYAAAHSLMARGLLQVNMQTGEKHLEPSLAEIVGGMARNNLSLRCSRTTQAGEDVSTFFIASPGIIQHTLRDEVVSRLILLPDLAALSERCAIFFDLQANGDSESMESEGILSAALLDEITGAGDDVRLETVMAMLEAAGFPAVTAGLLATDLLTAKYRGSVLRIAQTDGRANVEQGILLLKGAERLWLMVLLADDPGSLSVMRGNAPRFVSLLATLLRQDEKQTGETQDA